MGMLLGSLAATAPGWGLAPGRPPWFVVPCVGVVALVWRGGLRTGEWTRAGHAAVCGGCGLLVLMYFDRVPCFGGLVVV